MPDINFVARVHTVKFWKNEEIHTIGFARRAEEACGTLKGLASPNNVMAAFGATKGEVIEKLRLELVELITNSLGGEHLDSFTFNMALSEVMVPGMFWSGFGGVYGSDLKVHKRNEGWDPK